MRTLISSAVCLLALVSLAEAQSVTGGGAMTATVFSSGAWQVNVPRTGWQFSGGVGAPVQNIRVTSLPADQSGGCNGSEAVTFDYTVGASQRTASIRLCNDKPLALFSVTWNNGGANTAPFPVISAHPAQSGGFRHLSYGGLFAHQTFDAVMPDSPTVFFDSHADSFVFSAASNYMVAAVSSAPDGSLISGISDKISTLPAGYTHRTILVPGHGINAMLGVWGESLTALTGKKRPAAGSDVSIDKLSYWTDNGAEYYYNPGPVSYTDTLLGVKSELAAKGIALGSVQLDSWWYPKGPDGGWTSGGGIWMYQESPGVFPGGLAGREQQLGLPLITHARWIDANSPLRSQFKVSGNAAVDRAYWDQTAAYLQSAGVTVYEQDWLGSSAQTDFNLSDPYAFLGNMAAAMKAAGIAIQYCMALPAHFLESTNYANLHSIRVSQDGFGPGRWTEFLYASRLAGVLGLAPFADVLRSTSLHDLVLSALSSGPVGIGDALGSISGENLLKVVRADGVIVKPDVPAAPVDSVVLADAAGTDVPMLAAAYTASGNGRTYYLVAYKRDQANTVRINPAAYGITGRAWLFDRVTGSGRLLEPGTVAVEDLTDGFGYWQLAPVGRSGIGFMGDSANFVGLGKQRISSIADDGKLTFTVEFAQGEKERTIFGFSHGELIATALSGSQQNLRWHNDTGMFTMTVKPDPDTHQAQIRLTPQQAVSISHR